MLIAFCLYYISVHLILYTINVILKLKSLATCNFPNVQSRLKFYENKNKLSHYIRIKILVLVKSVTLQKNNYF